MLTEKLNGKHKLFITMSFLAYVAMSLPYTVQGSLAPVTMEFYGINATQQGLIMTMQSVGALGASIFIALRGERYNKIHTIALGLIIIGVMGAVIGSAPAYAMLLVIVIVMGIGAVFIDILQNSVISDVYTARKTTVLPLLHGFYMCGAMLVPVLVTMITNPNQPGTFIRPFQVLFVVALAVGIIYFFSGRNIMADTPYKNMDAMKKRVAENPAEVFKTKKAWFFMGVGLLFFTFQMGATMWLPTFTIRNTGADFSMGGMALTVFFAGNLIMRLVSPLFFRIFTPRTIYSVFGGISGVLMVAGLFAQNLALMFALIGAAGFMQGAMVAAFMLMCIDAFPDRTASAASITTMCVGIANLTAPLWMGALSTYTGFLVPMIMICCCLFVAAALIFFKTGKLHPAKTGS